MLKDKNKRVIRIIVLNNSKSVLKLEDGSYRDCSGRNIPFCEKNMSTLIKSSHVVEDRKNNY